MEHSDSIQEIAAAMAKFQAEVKNPANTAVNPFLKNKYAPLSEVLNTVRPILGKYGLSIIQNAYTSDTVVYVATTLLHSSGEWIEFEPLAIQAEKGTAQAIGGAITYGRRYAISAILGISSEDDDDGNAVSAAIPAAQQARLQQQAAPPSNKITAEQRKRMFAMAKGHNDLLHTILDAFGYQHSADVTKSDYDKICEEVAKTVAELEATAQEQEADENAHT